MTHRVNLLACLVGVFWPGPTAGRGQPALPARLLPDRALHAVVFEFAFGLPSGNAPKQSSTPHRQCVSRNGHTAATVPCRRLHNRLGRQRLSLSPAGSSRGARSKSWAKLAVRTARYRFIERASGQNELYDCRTDPAEDHDLAADPASQKAVEELKSVLRAGWRGAKPAD